MMTTKNEENYLLFTCVLKNIYKMQAKKNAGTVTYIYEFVLIASFFKLLMKIAYLCRKLKYLCKKQ